MLLFLQGSRPFKRKQNLKIISCDGATNIITFETSKARTGIFYAPSIPFGDSPSMDNGVGWTLEVKGIAYDLKATGEGYVDYAINNHPYLSTILKAFEQDWAGLSIANLTNEDLRIKLIPDSVFDPAVQTVWPTNPAWSVDELGVYSFCLSATKFELADMEPLAFHITSIEEASGWFEVDFFGVPIGTEVIVDWGDGSPIEKLIALSEYVNPYHYYTTVDHIAKFTVNNPVGGWFCQSANIDGVISFGAVQAESIQLNKTDRLISVPVILPSYIKNIQLGGELLNDPVISNWDTSNLTDMSELFRACYSFNQPLSGWNVSNVTDMGMMFNGSSAFNQDISNWCVTNILSEPDSFNNGGILAAENYPVWGTCPSEITEPTLLSFRVAAPDYSRYIKIPEYTLDDGTTMEVDWGDGSPVQTFVKGGETPEHSYATDTECICTFKFNQSVPMLWFWGDAVTEVISFGTTPITNPRFGFETLTKVPENLPSYVTSMSSMFGDCLVLNDPNISGWDVSNVTDMYYCFGGCSSFNQPLDTWDTSNVTNMSGVFDLCSVFNQPLNSWNTEKVTTFERMFRIAEAFNQPLHNWNVSSGTNFEEMFEVCRSFDQPLGNWDMSSAQTLGEMFRVCEKFNQPLNDWNVANVTNLNSTFGHCYLFNQPLNQWNVSNVTDMDGLFSSCYVFNQPLDTWDVSSVTTMSGTFSGTSVYNQPLDGWNVSNVTNMYSLFSSSGYNLPLNSWNVSNVNNMYGMFSSTSFNQPLDNWNTSNVTNMGRMFENSISFNKPLNTFDTSKVTFMTNMFAGSKVFNQPLDTWDVSSVDGTLQWGGPINNMAGVFKNALMFNQDLSMWCVSQIPPTPYEFDLGAISWTLPKPVWGTCPSGV